MFLNKKRFLLLIFFFFNSHPSNFDKIKFIGPWLLKSLDGLIFFGNGYTLYPVYSDWGKKYEEGQLLDASWQKLMDELRKNDFRELT